MLLEMAYLFQGMSPEFMRELEGCSTHETRGQGSILFRAGDPADCLYLIEAGRVRLSAGVHGTVTQIVEKQGDALGWSSLVGRDSYSSTAECLTDIKLVRISRDGLNGLFERYPACGVTLFRRLARMLGERLIESYRQISAAHAGAGTVRYRFGG
jgi:CRP-like cAMP-binding protein